MGRQENAVRIHPATTRDAAAIAKIYNHYVLNTTVTFEESPVATREMAARIREVAALKLPWLAAELGGELAGFAYATKWKGRCAYRRSVESTVYLAPDAVARGIGTKLYAALFARLRRRSIHVVIGGIALPNRASVRLHEKFGMRKAAHFREVGWKFDRWIDVGYWQTVLEGAES